MGLVSANSRRIPQRLSGLSGKAQAVLGCFEGRFLGHLQDDLPSWSLESRSPIEWMGGLMFLGLYTIKKKKTLPSGKLT